MQYKFFFLIITLILIFGAACSDDDSGDSSSERHTYPCSGTTCEFVEIPSDGKFTDTSGDVEITFIDLTEITVTVSDTTVSIAMTVSNLPAQLTYNRLLGAGVEEYNWSIWFDTDNSSKLSDGDLSLGLSYNNQEEGAAEAQGALLDFVQVSLCEFEMVDGIDYRKFCIGTHNSFITKTVTNNTITISVEKSDIDKIGKITSSTKVHFDTKYNDGENIYRDIYPNQ